MARRRPFEVRSYRPPASAGATQHYQWFRAAAPVGDDPLIHRGFLAFASDMGLLSSAMLPHEVNFWSPGLVSTSLDHAMRSEEQTSELQSLMRISYAGFC